MSSQQGWKRQHQIKQCSGVSITTGLVGENLLGEINKWSQLPFRVISLLCHCDSFPPSHDTEDCLVCTGLQGSPRWRCLLCMWKMLHILSETIPAPPTTSVKYHDRKCWACIASSTACDVIFVPLQYEPWGYCARHLSDVNGLNRLLMRWDEPSLSGEHKLTCKRWVTTAAG